MLSTFVLEIYTSDQQEAAHSVDNTLYAIPLTVKHDRENDSMQHGKVILWQLIVA